MSFSAATGPGYRARRSACVARPALTAKGIDLRERGIDPHKTRAFYV
jgi:hypothetical protein